jgi:hypothetical protein
MIKRETGGLAVILLLLFAFLPQTVNGAPQVVEVTVVLKPDHNYPSEFNLNSTNYFTLSYYNNGIAQTTHIYQNTTVGVDNNTIISISGSSSNTRRLDWTIIGPTAALVSGQKQQVTFTYGIFLLFPSVSLLFNNKPYSNELGVLKSIQTVLGLFGGYTLEPDGSIAKAGGYEITQNVSVPTEWWNGTGVWRITGVNTVPVLSTLRTYTFNYLFVRGAQPELPEWHINNTRLYAGQALTVVLSSKFPIFISSYNVLIGDTSLQQVGSYSSSVIAFQSPPLPPGSFTLKASANLSTNVIAPSPSGEQALISTENTLITSVSILTVRPPKVILTFNTTGLPEGAGSVVVNNEEHGIPYSFAGLYGTSITFSFPQIIREGNTTYVLTSQFPASMTLTSNSTTTASYISVKPVVINHTVYANRTITVPVYQILPLYMNRYVPYIPWWVWVVVLAAVVEAFIIIALSFRERRKQEKETGKKEEDWEKEKSQAGA